jgi:DNA polymerase III epsilon subunit-like protein
VGVKHMLHCNGHILCAVDIETTGLEPGFHEIWQICVLPLDSDLKPSKVILPFYMDLKPEMPENADPKAISREKLTQACLRGMNQYKAADMLVEWFEKKLGLAMEKRIMPLGCNYAFDQIFLRLWMGNKSYAQVFDGRYRDVMCASLYANDSAYFAQEQIPYSKNSLSWCCAALKVENTNPHDALSDCMATAEVYRLMLRKLF